VGRLGRPLLGAVGAAARGGGEPEEHEQRSPAGGAHALAQVPPDYEAIFGPLDPALDTDPLRFPPAGKPKAAGAADGAWEAMADADRQFVNGAFANYGKALEAYLRRLVDGGARFDAFVTGQADALTADEVAGLRLFVGKAGCVQCHGGPHFSDGQFHALGLPQTGTHVPAMDLGRFTDLTALLASPLNSMGAYSDDRSASRLAGVDHVVPEGAKGQFRTPSLRNVAVTAPYMHAGQLKTLEEVIDYYDRGGDARAGTKDPALRPLGLSADEKRTLVAFLGTLTGAALPASLLQDTSAP
jgi:cytochrome c peroxidase